MNTSFYSAEQRQYTREFDILMQRVEHGIGAAAMSGHFSKNSIHTLRSWTKGFFLPNIRNDTLEIPKPYRYTNTTPVLVTSGHKSYIYGETFWDETPAQSENARQQLDQLGFTRRQKKLHEKNVQNAMKRGRASPSESLPSNVWARVLTLALPFADQRGNEYLRALRPHMLVRYDLPPVEVPSTVIHEDVHVIQANREPIRNVRNEADHHFSRELEAYDCAHSFNEALLTSGLAPYGALHSAESAHVSRIVSEVCDLNPPHDRYAPNIAARLALMRSGVRITS